MPTEKVYTNVTPAKWNRIRDIVYGYGIHLQTFHGTANAYGVTLEWNCDPEAQTLKISILDAGLFFQPTDALNFVDGIISKA